MDKLKFSKNRISNDYIVFLSNSEEQYYLSLYYISYNAEELSNVTQS